MWLFSVVLYFLLSRYVAHVFSEWSWKFSLSLTLVLSLLFLHLIWSLLVVSRYVQHFWAPTVRVIWRSIFWQVVSGNFEMTLSSQEHSKMTWFCFWRDSAQWARVSSCMRFLTSHTTKHHSREDSSGRVISLLQRPLPENTRNTHNRQTTKPPLGFEPTISAGEGPQTYALGRAARKMTWVPGIIIIIVIIIIILYLIHLPYNS
jgi:hypothetical protein